jgi:hypothetical protein
MLKGTNFWTNGEMNLWVNNEPAKVYVPKSNVKEAYDIIQSRLSKEGSIPIGIDHLPDDIINANPILAKLNLLDVGEISKIKYANDTITIVEAKLTNPQILALYEAGELDMVSIVATSNVSECPKDYDYIVNSTDITRVDIVEKGACPTCNIPKPHNDDDTVVYARYSIKGGNTMADELTPEAIKAMLDEALKPINERLDKQDKAIEDIKTSMEENGEEGGEADPKPSDETNKEVEAKIAELKKESATAQVNMAIMAGKIVPAQKDSMIELCAKDSEAFAKLMEATPVTVPLDERKSLLAGESGNDPEDDEPTPEEVNLKATLEHFGGE